MTPRPAWVPPTPSRYSLGWEPIPSPSPGPPPPRLQHRSRPQRPRLPPGAPTTAAVPTTYSTPVTVSGPITYPTTTSTNHERPAPHRQEGKVQRAPRQVRRACPGECRGELRPVGGSDRAGARPTPRPAARDPAELSRRAPSLGRCRPGELVQREALMIGNEAADDRPEVVGFARGATGPGRGRHHESRHSDEPK